MTNRLGSSPAERPVSNGEEAGSVPARGSFSGVWHYIVLRRELTGGALLAQAVHAAGESATLYASMYGPELPPDTRACVLVATKEQMLALITALEGAEVPYSRIDETDGVLAGSTTALGLVTNDRESVRALLGHLKPWRAA